MKGQPRAYNSMRQSKLRDTAPIDLEEAQEQHEREMARAQRMIELLQHRLQAWERRASAARRLLSDDANDRKAR
jgi:hypothetical protein